MAAEKNKLDQISLTQFLVQVDPVRSSETRRLIALFQQVTGFEPVVWGGSMLGFGRYAYRYESGHAGESFAAGFAPRKADLVLYGLAQDPGLLAQLGKHRLGKGCVYIKRLDAANPDALAAMIGAGLTALRQSWAVLPA